MKAYFYVFIVGAAAFYFSEIKAFCFNLLYYVYKLTQKFKKRKLTMYEKLPVINGTAKPNFIIQAYNDMQLAFSNGENKKSLFALKCVCATLSLSGMIAAFILKSYLLIPILGVGLALIPMWFTRLKSYKQAIRLHDELGVSLSAITASYLRTENFIKAVEENLSPMKQPLKKAFEEFVFNYHNVDKSLINGIKLLSCKIDHAAFNEWCDTLIICQKDKNHIPALMAINATLDSEKRLYEKLKIEIYTPLLETIIIIFIILLTLSGLNIFSSVVVAILLNTVLGQLLCSLLAVTIFIALDRAIKYCNPQMRGGE